MSEDTAGPDQVPADELPPLPGPPVPEVAPQPTYGGEKAPSRKARKHAPDPDEVTGVLGLGGEAIAVPSGVWFAETDGQGNLLRDGDGNVVRTRSPHRPPRSPLGPPVG